MYHIEACHLCILLSASCPFWPAKPDLHISPVSCFCPLQASSMQSCIKLMLGKLQALHSLGWRQRASSLHSPCRWYLALPSCCSRICPQRHHHWRNSTWPNHCDDPLPTTPHMHLHCCIAYAHCHAAGCLPNPLSIACTALNSAHMMHLARKCELSKVDCQICAITAYLV